MNSSSSPVSSDEDVILFASGEEAWFWFCLCQKLRSEFSGKNNDSGVVVRPCTPDDIYRTIMGLYQKRRLESYHLQVLGQYGEKLLSPDPYRPDQASDARLWDEAMDALYDAMCEKGLAQ